MTLQELIHAIDNLSPDEVAQVKAHIEKRQSSQRMSHSLSSDLERELENALAEAQPVTLQAGTMDVDQLESAMASIREGFTQQELNSIADAIAG
ncbi:MAG: hypothetical protein AAFR81_27005 [Chloroflexota bacterium]